jgi:hypothetical protein
VGRTELVNRANDTESQVVVDAYKTFIRNTISIFASDDAEKAAADIVEFEAQLAQVSYRQVVPETHLISMHTDIGTTGRSTRSSRTNEKEDIR